MGVPEEVLLDGNELARGREYFGLGYGERSPDEKLLAYAVDTDGSERHQLRFRDLGSGADLHDVIRAVYYGAAWSAASRTFFYVMPDPPALPFQVRRHPLRTPVSPHTPLPQHDDQ